MDFQVIHSNEIRFDPLRGSAKNQPSPWQTDAQGCVVWTEPTSIKVVLLFGVGALGLVVAGSMWRTNRIFPMGGLFQFAFDAVFVIIPAMVGLCFWLRALQRAAARRSVVVDVQRATCTVHTRTITAKTIREHQLSDVRIHVVSLAHVVPARGFIGVSRTPRHHVVLVTPTEAFQIEQCDSLGMARTAAESLSAQVGIALGGECTDGVVSTIRSHFRAPF